MSREYDALPRLEKTAFAERVTAEYGWGQKRLQEFAQIGRIFPAKSELISRCHGSAKIDEMSSKTMLEITRTDDKLLATAAKRRERSGR